MVKKKNVRIDEEVVAWANKYYRENKEVLQVLGINSVRQLISRILKIQPKQIDEIVELKHEICDISATV